MSKNILRGTPFSERESSRIDDVLGEFLFAKSAQLNEQNPRCGCPDTHVSPGASPPRSFAGQIEAIHVILHVSCSFAGRNRSILRLRTETTYGT